LAIDLLSVVVVDHQEIMYMEIYHQLYEDTITLSGEPIISLVADKQIKSTDRLQVFLDEKII
jgi:hypothetical protein